MLLLSPCMDVFSSYMEFSNFSTQRRVWILPFTKLHAPLPGSYHNYVQFL